MKWWQTDILAALEASSEGLEVAQGEIAKAYRAAIAHMGLTDAAESETRSMALMALQTALARAVAFDKTQQPASGRNVGDLVLDLLYILTCLELLKYARSAIASALESVWAEAPGSEPSQPYRHTRAGVQRHGGRSGDRGAGPPQGSLLDMAHR